MLRKKHRGSQGSGDGAVAAAQAPPDDPPEIKPLPAAADVDPADPLWGPIDGVPLEHYAWISKLAAQGDVRDEAGIRALAEQHGIDGDRYWAASFGWADRMGENPQVAERFQAMLAS